MCSEIQAACRETAQPIPESDAELARCIFDSLALLYADVLHELAQLRGEDFSQLHIVGGGCQNALLNQLCADACGIRVIAGPVEASTLGNIGIQLMTLDELNNVG
ncbi:rhamnulokinase [Escherichia coli]|uniref:Rhamnulokinase n=1 Tax=Escherichia coli TaxID=562 RepID=A0A3S4MN86_ECOLX|nr:rhamnulokinase [Escherichia coli]